MHHSLSDGTTVSMHHSLTDGTTVDGAEDLDLVM